MASIRKTKKRLKRKTQKYKRFMMMLTSHFIVQLWNL